MPVSGPRSMPSRVHWRAFFRDPRLQRLIEAALTHNSDLKSP